MAHVPVKSLSEEGDVILSVEEYGRLMASLTPRNECPPHNFVESKLTVTHRYSSWGGPKFLDGPLVYCTQCGEIANWRRTVRRDFD